MRIEGWEKEIENYIQETMKKEFSWGECDCLIFISDAVKIMTGIDPMSKKYDTDPETIRGAYNTEAQAYYLIKNIRGSIPNIMNVHFETVQIPFAQRGDIVLGKMDDGEHCFGLVWNGGAYFKTKQPGILIKPVDKIARISWRVD